MSYVALFDDFSAANKFMVRCIVNWCRVMACRYQLQVNLTHWPLEDFNDILDE